MSRAICEPRSDAANRRAHVRGGRGLESGRSAVGARLRSAADLHEERATNGAASRSIPATSGASARASTRRASRPVVSHASYLINLATTVRRAAAAVDRGVHRRARSRGRARAARRRHPSGHVHRGDRGGRAAADCRRDRATRSPRAAARARRWCCSSTRRGRGGRSAIASSILRRSSSTSTARRASACASTPVTSSRPATTSSTEAGYRETFDAFDRLVGLDRLQGLSRQRLEEAVRQPRRSARAHRSRGASALEPFRRLLHDPRFAGLPLLIETEKSPAPSRAGADRPRSARRPESRQPPAAAGERVAVCGGLGHAPEERC